MATNLTENSIAGDLQMFDELFKHAYPNYKRMRPENLLRKMVEDGVIQTETLLEKAISVCGKLERDSTTGRDFTDGSDAKKCITRPCIEKRPMSGRRRATVQRISGKEGTLRIMVNETLTGKNYFFKIPKAAYAGMRRILFYFNEDGTPKYDSKWFQYQVSSFKELCQ
jgi:hypothetical protein